MVEERKILNRYEEIPPVLPGISTELDNDKGILGNQKNGSRFFNELESWLKFNARVAEEGNRSTYPIVERLNFIGIADSNLDEFIRTKFDKSKHLKRLISAQTKRIEEIYDKTLIELRDIYGINITTMDEIKHEKDAYIQIKQEFKKNIYPEIQPLILANELPIPNMADGGSFIITKLNNEREVSCIIKLPETRLIKVKKYKFKQTYVLIEDVILHFIQEFYRGYDIVYNDTLRVLRKVDSLNADDSDYIYGIKKQIKDRTKASIQMIDTNGDFSQYTGLFKSSTKRRKRKYVYGLAYLKNIHNIINYDDNMVFDKVKPKPPIKFIGESMFDILSETDVLVHFPYESFQLSTVRLLEEAANDPDVICIKQTLYRVAKDSPLVNSLMKAAKNGKQVIVLLELKAKMDEKNNLELTEKLKDAGCNIIFGPIRMKTHAKLTLIIRRENGKLAKYANISTGNFNDKTAKIYEDLSYFTKERSKFKIGVDLCDVFNYLGGCSSLSSSNDLLISPITFRSKITEEICKCIDFKNDNPDKEVIITMKCNAFTDKSIAQKLYDASNAGVKIRLIIRGMCIVKPGIVCMSENIEVISIVGRYLEHSRIYEFNYIDGDNSSIYTYIGSGDMMPRNLDYRVEVIVPIRTLSMRLQINEILNSYLADNTNSHKLLPNGDYTQPDELILDEQKNSVQENFIKFYKKRAKSIIR